MKFLWLIFGILPWGLRAQTFPVDAATGKIYYAEEVLVKDGPQLDLYHRTKAWFAQVAKTGAVIKVDDLPNGLLIGSNYFLLRVRTSGKNQTYQVWYTLKLEMEDDRYWYSLTDFQLQPINQKDNVTPAAPRLALETLVLSPPTNLGLAKQINEITPGSIQRLIQELKNAMD